MLDELAIGDQNPLVLLLIAVGGAALLWILWGELRHRARRHGGDDRAAAVMFASVVAVLVTMAPGVVPFEFGLMVLGACVAAILRPDVIVKTLGGPNVRWRALREGRELQVLVAERGGPRAAAVDVEVAQRVAGLRDLEADTTSRYIGLLGEVLLADPGDAGAAAARERLDEADAELRASLRARPTWERALQRRMLDAGGNAAWATAG